MQQLLDKLKIAAVNRGACTGANDWRGNGPPLQSYSPIHNQPIAEVTMASPDDFDHVVNKSIAAFQRWRTVPAPLRGQLVRDLGNVLRENCEPLGELVALRNGKDPC